MIKQKAKYVYGPLHSWRLGMSLGIDPLSNEQKICNFNCVYCQLGPTQHLEHERKIFVPVQEIVSEINDFSTENIDYFTFAGRGEPTLAKNLGEMIRALKNKQRKIAVITNSSLLGKEDVQNDLKMADFVIAKLDAGNEKDFAAIARPEAHIRLENVIEGIKDFRVQFPGKLAVDIMFINGYGKGDVQLNNISEEKVQEIVDIVKTVGADEIEINTPLRLCACCPVAENQLIQLKEAFCGLPIVTVYDKERKVIPSMCNRETIKRHGRNRIKSR